MKLNNKGFAISGVLYALLILFITLFIGILTVLASTKFSLDKVKGDIESKLQLNTNISSSNNCIRDVESTCPKGTRINVKVNASENYNFLVVNDNGNKITMIMDRNLGGKVAWITEEDYISVGGSSYGTDGNNGKGPMTVLKTLELRTKNWTNVPLMSYTLSDDGDGNKYSSFERSNVRARLLTYSESKALGCTYNSSGTCLSWLYENTGGENTDEYPMGYWLSAAASNSIGGMVINSDGSVYYTNVGIDSERGVRPVITISKTL